jgi:hypothetical protein
VSSRSPGRPTELQPGVSCEIIHDNEPKLNRGLYATREYNDKHKIITEPNPSSDRIQKLVKGVSRRMAHSFRLASMCSSLNHHRKVEELDSGSGHRLPVPCSKLDLVSYAHVRAVRVRVRARASVRNSGCLRTATHSLAIGREH